MNEHLQPVFEVLLPELEKERIKYWVYGGVGIAAVAGRFFRHNTDVDIFVQEADFVRGISLLDGLCRQNALTPYPVPGRKLKFEVRAQETDKIDILSMVAAYKRDRNIEFIFRTRRAHYPNSILTRVPRYICGCRFFSPPDQYIRELFRTYLTNRPDKKRSTKVLADAREILSPEEFVELMQEGR